MNFCRASLNTFKKLMVALSESDPALGRELEKQLRDEQTAISSAPTSSLSMALGQLGLIERSEADTSNLSV